MIRFKKINPQAITPTRGSEYAAGYDLYALIDMGRVRIYPGECVKIHTGIAMEIPPGYFGALFARSGLATKNGLRLATGVSVIDSDYRGEIILFLYNDSNAMHLIENGDRVAQIVFIPYAQEELLQVEYLSETERGAEGFGSTGVSLDDQVPGQMTIFDYIGSHAEAMKKMLDANGVKGV